MVQKPRRQLARESAARLQELVEVPKAPKVTTLRKPSQAIEDSGIDDELDEKRSETRLTDDQLQLVAQMLHEGQVDFDADDEPLPGVSDRLLRKPPADLADVNMIGECGSPQSRWSWVAGVEATFLNPDLNGDGAAWLVADAATGRDALFSSQNNEVDSIYLSPRVWIGVQGSAWGANLRYWHLDASEYFADPSVGSTGAWDDFDAGIPDVGLFSTSRLEAYTIDLELTRRFCLNDCSIQSSVGLRHAEIDHAESLAGMALASGTSLFGSAATERRARGTGVVLGWYGRKPIAPCSSIHWYYNLRWSALWGPTQTVAEAGAGSPTSGVNASTTSARTNLDDELYIGEAQLGLEWNRALECLPAQAFLRAGIEYQRWTGGLGYSQSSALAGNSLFTTTGATLAGASAPELDLIGITLGAGLTW